MKKQLKKACVIGHFGFGSDLLNGQTIKTKTVNAALETLLGEDQIMKIDTRGGTRELFRVFRSCCKAFRECENILIFPAHNGVRFFAPVCFALQSIYKRKVHYVVIGGWLPTFLETHRLAWMLKRFEGVYVETSTMKRLMEEKGFKNVVVLPNFKDLSPLTAEEMPCYEEEPHRLCTFSRVMKEKGIVTAMEIVRDINEKYGRQVYSLDIFGQMEPGEEMWFLELKNHFPDYIHYGGVVPFSESVEKLKNYFALLFPTEFYTEGIPGTILDAYAAGIPVISARWESFSDVVDDGITGLGYDFNDAEGLRSILEEAAENPHLLLDLKENCLKKARQYLPTEAVQNLKLD